MRPTVKLEGDFEVWHGAAEPMRGGSVRLNTQQFEALAERAAATVGEWRRKADAYDALLAKARTAPVTKLAAARALDAKIQAVMAKMGLDYNAALEVVAREDPAAVAAYQSAK